MLSSCTTSCWVTGGGWTARTFPRRTLTWSSGEACPYRSTQSDNDLGAAKKQEPLEERENLTEDIYAASVLSVAAKRIEVFPSYMTHNTHTNSSIVLNCQLILAVPVFLLNLRSPRPAQLSLHVMCGPRGTCSIRWAGPAFQLRTARVFSAPFTCRVVIGSRSLLCSLSHPTSVIFPKKKKTSVILPHQTGSRSMLTPGPALLVLGTAKSGTSCGATPAAHTIRTV